jgi:hypothetical protein
MGGHVVDDEVEVMGGTECTPSAPGPRTDTPTWSLHGTTGD